MTRTHPGVPWCRYADDGLVHCRTEQEAQAIMAALSARLAACGLQMRLNFRNRTELSLRDISRLFNPVLRGWVAHYGRFYPSAMYPVFRHFNKTLT